MATASDSRLATFSPAETAVLAKARALGLSLPTFTLLQAPEPFAAWADRVAWADCQRARGKLAPADLDECDRQLGLPGSHAVKPVGRSLPCIEALAGVDPLAAIAAALADFAQEGAAHVR